MENNVSIIPAKINEKPLKLLGIISAVVGIGYILYMIINFFSNNYSVDFGEFAEVLIRNIFSHSPFILFGVYALFFAKKKINHPLLWISYIVFAAKRIIMFFEYNGLKSMFTRPLFALEEFFDGNLNMASVYLSWALDNWYYLLAFIVSIVFIIDIIKNFQLAKVSKILAGVLLVTFGLAELLVLPNTISFLFDDGLKYALSNTIVLILNLAEVVPFLLFWFLVIKKGAKKIKLAPQPVAQPVYQAPVQPVAQPVYQQPVAQPMYQQPVQPVAQPVYQRPVQPQFVTPVQAPVIEDDKPTVMLRPEENFEKKLMELKKLRDAGILTDEDFEKKKTEILSRI